MTLSSRAQALLKSYETATPHSVPLEEAKDVALGIKKNEAIYQSVSAALGGKIPTWFIGCLHYRECSTLSQRSYLGNGQLIIGSLHKTSIEPLGRGPFKTFQAGAVDILKHQGFDKLVSWTVGECLERAEMWNGTGYRSLGVVNPYLFAGTSIYVSGKYVADHVYNARKVDNQLGFALLMKAIGIK